MATSITSDQETVPEGTPAVASGFEVVARGTTGRGTRMPLPTGLPPVDGPGAPPTGTILRDPSTGKRYSLRPAKRCYRCDGTGTHAAHWDEV